MAVDSVQNVENYIRDIAKDKKCRFRENFLDYDNLRLGYVTTSQFFRVLRSLIDIPLQESQEKAIIEKYGMDKQKYINWQEFVRHIEGKYDEHDFLTPPETKILMTINSPCVGTKAFRSKPGDDEFDYVRPLLSRINQFITNQGHIIRDCYRQFDKHNMGLVTESQFFRCFPGPPDITEEELTALVQRYKSITNPGFVDYLSFENDLKQLGASEKLAKDGTPFKPEKEALTIYNKKDLQNPSQHMIIDRIRFAVHHRGIRVMDFFIDYDKLRHDLVSEHQFVCALMAAVGKEAQLSREEVQMLANYYRSGEDRNMIRYREFCRKIDSPFHVLDLEKDPLKRTNMPSSGALSRVVMLEKFPILHNHNRVTWNKTDRLFIVHNKTIYFFMKEESIAIRACVTLSPEEEIKVSSLLEKMRSKVEKERLQTYPYFKDFDMAVCSTGVITANQFSRVLHFLGLNVSEEDCRCLCRKFADPRTGEVNYAAFCQHIDSWFQASAPVSSDDLSEEAKQDKTFNALDSDREIPAIGDSLSGKTVSRRDWLLSTTPIIKSTGDQWPVEVLIDRIRHLVLVNRISLKHWFHDFDQLRTGFMTKSQFERCLTAAGLTRLDLHDLTPKQVDTLCQAYISPTDSNKVNWIKFVNDIDTVFTIPELEKQPLTRVLPQETFIQPRSGTADWSTATDEMKQNFERSMSILRRKIHERRMLIAPDFYAFDYLHRGLVSTNNFRQLISMCGFCLTPEEIDSIIARFANDDGFDYKAFLDTLDPPSEKDREYKYPKRLELLQKVNNSATEHKEMEPIMRDTEGVLELLRAEVYRRRIRLSEWFRDQDKLNHGYMPRLTFRRCLGVLPLSVSETAFSLIEDRYKTSNADFIDWRKFCADIEIIFQEPNLEKDPLKEPEVYAPDSKVAQNYLSTELAKIVDGAITKLGDKVRQRRLQLLPMFSDFDETHRLTVSQNQFRRVLMTLELANLLSEQEWTAIYCKYRHPLGVVDNINYQAFIDDVYTAAGIETRVP